MNRTKVITILLALSIVLNVVLFFYGLINNIQMKKERAALLESKSFVEKYRLENIQLQQELQKALSETRQAKDYAIAQAMAAQEAAQNKK